MARTWNQRRYVAGVDFAGASRPDQHAAQEREREGMGITAFDPAAITRILASPRFHLYRFMVLSLDEIPDSLTQDSELCVRHSALHPYMSQYMRQQMMENILVMGGRRALSLVGSFQNWCAADWKLQLRR